MIEKETYLTGHMYRGSAYESDSGCGNCNGANCDYCRRITSYDILISIPSDYNGEVIIENVKLYNADNKEEAEYIQNNIYCFECSYGEYSNDLVIKNDYYSLLKIRNYCDNRYAKFFIYIKEDSLKESIDEIKKYLKERYIYVLNISKVIDL